MHVPAERTVGERDDALGALELLKEVLAGTKATFVLGGGDIAEQVKSLVRTELTPTPGADAVT